MGRQADYGNDFNAPLQLEEKASKAKKEKKTEIQPSFFLLHIKAIEWVSRSEQLYLFRKIKDGGPAFYISYTHIPSLIKVSTVLLSFAKCFFMLHFHAWKDNKNSLGSYWPPGGNYDVHQERKDSCRYIFLYLSIKCIILMMVHSQIHLLFILYR